MFKLPNKPYHVIQKFLNDNRPLVFKYIIKKVKWAIQQDVVYVELFEIPTATKNRHVAIVNEVDYEKILEQAIQVCSDAEEYETAAKAREVIEIYRIKYIDKLLNDI